MKGRLINWVTGKPPGSGEGHFDSAKSGELEAVVATLNRASEELSRLEHELELRGKELSGALRQQAATAEAIKAISRPNSDLQSVLDTLVKSAAKLSPSGHAAIYLRDGEMLRGRASLGARSKRDADQPLAIDRTTIFGRVMLSGQPEFISDTQADPQYDRARLAAWSKCRALMAVPLLRQGQVEGVLSVGQAEPGVFAARQSEFLQTLADQAVIAIESERHIEDERARNRELAATSETLRAIARSPGDVQPVFVSIAQSARRLCNAQYSFVFRFDGSHLHFMACDGLDPSAGETLRRGFPLKPGRDSAGARAVLSGAVEHIPDVSQDREYAISGHAKMLNAGSVVAVPMMREGAPTGAIVLGRTQTGNFPDGQVKLVQTFADQAAIAIENARLVEEGQARNRELAASSEILRAIPRSFADAQPVFDAIAQSARRLCNAQVASVIRFDGKHLHFMACDGLDAKSADHFRQAFPLEPGRDSAGARAIMSGAVEQIPDVGADPDYLFRGLAKKLKTGSSIAAVPMMRDNTPIGAIVIERPQTGSLPERQVQLLQTFADQAVIAIANVRLFDEVQVRNRELTETLEQQTASGAILRTIATSPTDVQPVLDAVAETAARLCKAYDLVILLKDGDMLSARAHHGPIPIASDKWPLGRDSVGGRSILDGAPVHVHDVLEAADEFPASHEFAIREGQRTVLSVPLLREEGAVGALVVRRDEVQPFSQKQIDLLTTFADQAVIAIGNARLFEEVQARNRELTHALEQQSATAEILRTISTTPTDAQPVFEAIVRNAVSLCGSLFANVFRYDGELLHWVASHNVGPGYVEFAKTKYPMRPDSSQVSGRVVLTRSVVRLEDALADANYDQRFAQAMGWRRMLGIPLLRKGNPLGVFVVGWAEPGSIAKAEEELLKSFADQAVIAIENARLFEEVQARNRELTEALEQQTATGAILRAIAASPTEIQPVLDAVAENAARLCAAYDSVILLKDGDTLVHRAHHGPMLIATQRWPIGRGLVSSRAVIDRVPVHVHDLLQAAEDFPESHGLAIQEGQRAILAVPLLREGQAIGALCVRRREPEPFSQKQIDLLTTFAAQSVIAIENVRLFEQVQARNRELTKALEQQSATAEILRTISMAPTDVQPVFEAIVRSAVSLCGSLFANVFRYDGELLHWVASHNVGPSYVELLKTKYPMRPDDSQVSGRVVLTRSVVRLEDALADANYDPRFPQAMGWRRMLGIPLIRGGNPLGVLVVGWAEPGSIAKVDEELLKSFADQAVIAIENARLFDEVQARNRELQEALDYQTATSEVLNVISRSPSALQPVLDVIIETAVRLCEADAGTIARKRDGGVIRSGQYGFSQQFTDLMTRTPVEMNRGSITGRTLVESKVVHVLDVEADPEYTWTPALEAGDGIRTGLGVPLLREGTSIGAIALIRRTVRPFTDKQIDLVTTFADQAVIAIENVRLFEEVQARNRDLTEALEQQTATGTILRAIAASPTDIQPVLAAVAESAAKLCEAYDAAILLEDGGALAVRAHHGPIPIDFDKWQVGRDWATGRAFVDRKPVHVHDLLEAADEFPAGHAMAARQGHRTILAVPLLRDEEAIGALAIRRLEVRPFSQKQIDLLTVFADQAVIAIENVRLFDEVQARNRDLSEALEQQTATGTILRVIASSPTDIQPVLAAVAESAAKLCEAYDAAILLADGDQLAVRVHHGPIPIDFTKVPIGRDWVTGRAFVDRKPVHVNDLPEAANEFPAGHAMAVRLGFRTIVAVPLLHEDEAIGALMIRRQELRPFSQKQIDLLTTLADQAVIAIENVRLFEEVRARNRDLSEALDQQTATSEVLKAITRSTFDLDLVLRTLVESAARLCDSGSAQIWRREGNVYRFAAGTGLDPAYVAVEQQREFGPGRGSLVGRAALEKRTVQILDLWSDPDYELKDEARTNNFRCGLGVPMLRDGEPVGVFTAGRKEVQPFSERQIALLTTFADQAVIAIENLRLFEEVQARNQELTATSEILRVISSSPTDIQPVFDVLAQNATQLCGAQLSIVYRYDGKLVHLMAYNGLSSDRIAAARQAFPMPPDRGSVGARAILSGAVVEIPDTSQDADYSRGVFANVITDTSALAVPMLREGVPIGAIAVDRRQTGKFPTRQVDLLKTFADQAVIAIENVRLFEEVQARTAELAQSVGELKALGEVSQAVNSTLDLKTVLETIVAKAVQLSETNAGAIYVYSKSVDRFRLRATYGMSAELIEAISGQAIGLNDAGIGEAARLREPVQVADLGVSPLSAVQKILMDAGFRSVLVVPLLRPGKVVGALVVRRRKPGQFTDPTVRLLETFAAQSVLAIQNARLFSEIEENSRQLEIASRHKSQFLANMSHELRTPLNSVLGFTEMLADGLYGELPDKAKTTLGRVQANGRHLLGLINDVLDLSKIEAGQLTLAIDDYAIGQIVKTVAATTEPLARAKGLHLSVTVAEGLPMGRGDERRLSQVLLNLAGNAVKFTEQGSIEIAAASRDGYFEVLVRDTGPGIAPEHQKRIFEEFQQVDESSTRQKGGTGLGLAISKRIVEMHGGTIGLSSELGSGSTFRVAIPVKAGESMGAP